MGSDQFFEKPADPADSDLDLTDESVEEPSGTPIETIPFDDIGTITDVVPGVATALDEGE